MDEEREIWKQIYVLFDRFRDANWTESLIMEAWEASAEIVAQHPGSELAETLAFAMAELFGRQFNTAERARMAAPTQIRMEEVLPI